MRGPMSELDLSTCPAPCAGLRWAELSDATLLVEADGEAVHVLNPGAGAVFALCDGQRSLGGIAEELGALLGEGAPDAAAVARWVQGACEEGYLVPGDGSACSVPELAGQELRGLARRLRERGDIELSLRCQERVCVDLAESAEEWLEFGELAHILGRRELTRAAYERYLELEPDDPEVEHMLLSLRDEAPPSRASDACVLQLYERFAPDYDRSMQDDLGYRAPGLLLQALQPWLGEARAALDVLDLGCGTGLTAERLRPWARHLLGVDLSPDMVALAEERGSHDELATGELLTWLQAATGDYDLVIACDVLIYFGELAPVLQAAAQRLRPGGRLAFTLERHAGSDWALTDSGRYAHSAPHVRELAEEVGLDVEHLEQEVLRHEYGEEVVGLSVVLAAPRADVEARG